MSQKPRGLFDEQDRFAKLTQKRDPLEQLQAHIDFEFFRPPLEAFFANGADPSKGGRPPYDYVLMFKILVLQRYYNLSDDTTEYAILDRLSFMRFLGLGLSDRVPDAKTIWLFRDKLTAGGLVEGLFKQLDAQLDQDGIIVHKGKLVDASFVQVPIQRNSREENEELKKGEVPKDWSDNKIKQKDTDARWTTKGRQHFFGYKNHVKADRKTKLITGYAVTTANVPDKEMLDSLLTEEEEGQPLYADSAYRSEAIEQLCVEKKVKSRIHEKGYRYKKITQRQQQANRRKSKVRARVEHIFGFMQNSMHGLYLRYRSGVRNAAGIGLINLTYNLFRLVQLQVSLSK